PVHNGGGSSDNPYGVIYGRPVKPMEFAQAQNEFKIFYWLHYNQWPDKAGFSSDDMDRETYVRLLLQRKAEKLDIRISQEALVTAAADFLHSVGRNGQAMPMQEFVERNLAPEGLTVADLQNFLHDELVVQQLIQTLGLSGALVTPQEAGLLYDREHQEVSAQAVFFSASNYLAQATVTPAAIGQFYTNNMAAYRVPDRVQVNYVAFEASNYLAGAKAELEKTNFAEIVDSIYNQYGATEFADAKTPEEAKTKIRGLLIHNRALADAHQAANAFATALFAMEPVQPENFSTLVKQQKLSPHTTAPFDAMSGPEDFDAPATFAKAAFQLSADVPFGGPIVGPEAVYVIALANKLPSTIPPLEQIHARVVKDLQAQEAVSLAQHAGTNFYFSLVVQMAADKTFAQAAVAAKQTPLVLPAFSLSTSALPELDDHATIGQIKQAAFTTKPGHISNFVPTEDGGFVLFVQELLPMDEAKKKADMPQFISQVRRARQNEAFNIWLQAEANRELQDTPFYKKETAAKAK
ncbi:MAG TPA: hypothetical protein VFF11_04570, partial [Candidatus Binatia bacterium]|nr:hypothetical protein [Candidatus Binatia bacterium]